MISESSRLALLLITSLKFFPTRWVLVEAATQQILEDACFSTEPAMDVDVASLYATSEVGSRCEGLGKLDLNPASVNFLGLGRGVFDQELAMDVRKPQESIGLLHHKYYNNHRSLCTESKTFILGRATSVVDDIDF